ncbi:ATP-binding protein [Halosimplex aquaticum]|uniref:histidine kinase n=1 Tax=Halosimplex aquaticum TaxID=3026162 RepID=A0ABD5YAT2_9EURY|nr:ATP-binding protein [Halosimplex aquaticum]
MVASDESEREPLVRAAEACDGADVAVAESFATARDRIDGDESACVAIGDVEEGLIEFLSSIEPDVPILYCPMDGDERTVAAAAAAGAGYVPRVDGLHDRLVNAMTDAVETYQERWVSATESTILDTMLSDLDVALYAKDERARHVKVADIKGGVPPGEQYGKTDREIFGDDHPFDSDETYRDDMRVIETGEPIREKIQHHGEEVPIWLRTTKVPLRDEDGPITGLVGISVDVTELKARIGALERRIERLEHFVSHAHHDLKNPLQVASGFLEIAREQDDDEVALEKIQGALNRMEEMFDDLRQTSQAGTSIDSQAGMVPLTPTVDDVWAAIDTEPATLDVAFPDGAAIRAADSDVRPLFENLLKNAVEHGSTSSRSQTDDAVEHGGEGVTVRVGPLADGFYVADDGPGIPAEERDAVTEQGYTTAESGSGSGLAIVSEIATDNEWDLVVTESESGGARFEFRNVMLVAEHPGPTIAGASHELDEAVDVGAVTTGDRGTYDAEADRWTIESDGTNIWQHDNGFHYVFTRVSGDVRIEGRVRDVERVIDYSKAGFMIRSGTDEDCAYGHVGATAAQGSEVLWRGRPGAGGRSQLLGDDADRFEYYRIDRVGDTVTCSVSRRGKDWYAVDQRPVEFDKQVLVGIAVSSLSPEYPTTAVVEDVTVTSLSEPQTG